MSLLAPSRWDLDRHVVLDIRGANAAARSGALAGLASEVADGGGQVRTIDPTAPGVTDDAGPLADGMETLFEALDTASTEPDRRHVVIIDRIELLLGSRSSASNAFDETLALLMGVAERSAVRVAIAVGSDLATVAPMTHFALRRATKFVV